jgi:protein-tyrosine phosphatase
MSRADLPNLLFVCGRNKRRSPTASQIFKKDERFNVRSAGLSPSATRRITAKDISWADLILVMEPDQRKRLWEAYPEMRVPPVLVLGIPNEYEFMDPELVAMLHQRTEEILEGFGV